MIQIKCNRNLEKMDNTELECSEITPWIRWAQANS